MKNIRQLFLICTVFFFIQTGYLKAQNSVVGTVYIDHNKNGIKDVNEKGLKDVGVSNGSEVVKTNAQGGYELPIGDDNIIFVIKPSNYQFLINEYQQPDFFYNHKPQGSPKAKYTGVAPTGELPKSVDFGLISSKESEDYEVILFGDPQPYTLEEVSHFNKAIVSELVGTDEYAFGISLGDLVGDDLTLFYPYLHSVARVGLPWYHVYGNHDMNFDAKEDHLADETFEAVFGPANYSFNYGKAHYIILDNVMYPDPRDGNGYWGGFRPDQLEFVKNDLKHVAKDQLIIVSFHIPITEFDNGDQYRDSDREALFDLLKDYPNTLSLSAHTHLQMHDFFGKDRGWKGKEVHHHYNVGTTSGDWYSGELDEFGTPNSRMRDGTPKGFAKLSISGNQYTFDYKPSGSDWSHKMHVHAPAVVPKNRRHRAKLVVNFFQGSKKDLLSYRVDGGEWKPMNYTPSEDPVIKSVHHQWEYSQELPGGKRPSYPTVSTHIWSASLSSNLEVGKHEIEVRATDYFGREYFEKSSYEIIEE